MLNLSIFEQFLISGLDFLLEGFDIVFNNIFMFDLGFRLFHVDLSCEVINNEDILFEAEVIDCSFDE